MLPLRFLRFVLKMRFFRILTSWNRFDVFESICWALNRMKCQFTRVWYQKWISKLFLLDQAMDIFVIRSKYKQAKRLLGHFSCRKSWASGSSHDKLWLESVTWDFQSPFSNDFRGYLSGRDLTKSPTWSCLLVLTVSCPRRDIKFYRTPALPLLIVIAKLFYF